MAFCDQPTITDAAFVHLSGIKVLNMRFCKQPTITGATFEHLRGVCDLDMAGCTALVVLAAKRVGVRVHT